MVFGDKPSIGKANERKGKVKGGKDEEVNGQGGKRGARPHTGHKAAYMKQLTNRWSSATNHQLVNSSTGKVHFVLM